MTKSDDDALVDDLQDWLRELHELRRRALARHHTAQAAELRAEIEELTEAPWNSTGRLSQPHAPAASARELISLARPGSAPMIGPAPSWCGVAIEPPAASRGGSAGRRLSRPSARNDGPEYG
jgi:hypothetical protein